MDESIARLLGILLPRMKAILAISLVAAAFVGVKLYFFTPRAYVSTAIIAPDVMRDLTSIDLVQLRGTNGDRLSLPFAQLKILAGSLDVKRGIIKQIDLIGKWKCEDENECLEKLRDVYSVKEIRNVGLEMQAQTLDPDLSQSIVDVGIAETNSYFKNITRARAEEDIKQIKDWINDVTQALQVVSSEYIRFASANNIAGLESQHAAGSSLLGTIKSKIVDAESELARRGEELGEENRQLLPIKESLKQLRTTLDNLQQGTDKDDIFPVLIDYEYLSLKAQDYQQQMSLLRSRAELFDKQLAAAQIQTQREARSIMVLDKPFVEPAGRGTVKFTILTFMAVFFVASVSVIMKEYWKSLRRLIHTTGKT